MKYVSSLLIILFTSLLFSKTYTEEEFRDMGWSPSLWRSGYGTSEIGARRDALSQCEKLMSSIKNQCQKENGSLSDEVCTAGTAQFSYGTYEVKVKASAWCAKGKKLISWRGSSVVSAASDFKAISDCRNEIQTLKDQCDYQRGAIQIGFEQQCKITQCREECTAYGYFRCVDL